MKSPIPPHGRRNRLIKAIAALATVMVAAGVVSSASAQSPPTTTLVYDEAGPAAARIGLVGDSTLSGVRWYADYGDLKQFNFVFDAESCRRTVETSCWSREGYRPENALTALRRMDGEWGDVLVVMSGYNDSSYLFDDAVDAIVQEARRQDIPKVMWLTLRTADVAYEEPMHQANGQTYDDANRVLFEKAADSGGYLEVADWATFSATRTDWFASDGVHLTPDGVDAVTSFIAEQVQVVLDGGTVTPDEPPWRALGLGHSGETVTRAQRALADSGLVTFGGVDGKYGWHTAMAVEEFQAEHGLDVTGTIDVPTAVALDLYDRPTFGHEAVRPRREPDRPAPGSNPQAQASVAPEAEAASTIPSGGEPMLAVVTPAAGGVIAAGFGATLYGRRRRQRRRDGNSTTPEPTGLVAPLAMASTHAAYNDDGPTFEMVRPMSPLELYDHEREEVGVAE